MPKHVRKEGKDMKRDKGSEPVNEGLRSRAENQVAKGALKTHVNGEMADDLRLLNELQVHQTELELQNEELRETRLAMEAALEKYADLYEFAPMGYFTLDDGGVVLEVNQTGLTLLGGSRSNLVGRRFSLFLAEESRDAFNAFLAKVLGKERKAVCEAALWGGPPHAQWVRIHGCAIETVENEPRRCRIALTDITGSREAQQDQGILQAQMQQAQRMESMGVLAGGIAHDFNNMLMAISGNAGLVLEDLPKNSPARAMVQEIVTVAGRAADLCGQMLAYAGKGRFRMEPLDLSKMAAEMSQMLAVSISKKTLISCRLYEYLPLVRADAAQMRQVLMNLILNASEAVGDTGGSISVSTGIRECDHEYLNRVRTTTMLAEGIYVFLEVTDTGCGMDTATMERMFDPFFSTKSLGRGLGLSAVMGIIHAHAGGIGIQSAPGRGTTITLLFPRAQVVDAAKPVPPEVSAGWKGKGTVLVVDDEDTVRAVCRRMLQHLGLEVLLARDGREALEIFRKDRDRIGCVLLDFAMPHLDGEETFLELRKIDPEARVILCSGYLLEDIMARFRGEGLAGFIHKPYLLEQLTVVMKKVFAQ